MFIEGYFKYTYILLTVFCFIYGKTIIINTIYSQYMLLLVQF